ncbi:hypothetical protein KIPB_006266 [Kipferlia bialata]|uniref:NACHT domain-containing protein n=1 Tax=Kipferlia bialata TaxID=797122 RepID=A0A9K3GIZ6_9EUKA|nr:hypothetical protein KIPB_006266 [Kipferlia bialata]|eukprot:g6266.t1
MPASSAGDGRKLLAFKKVLKTAGVTAASLAVPVAVALATGGVGIPVISAALPLARSVTQALSKAGVTIPAKAAAEKLAGCLGDGGSVVDGLFGLVKGGVKDARDRKRLKAQIEEAVRPHMVDMTKLLTTLRTEHDDMRGVMEGWIATQQEMHMCTAEHLSQIQSSLACVHGELEYLRNQCNASLDSLKSVTEDMSKLLRGMTADMVEMSLEDCLQVARCLLQEQCLHSEFGATYDSSRYVEIDALEDLYADFTRQCRGGSPAGRPLLVMLADMGMGKTWNAAHLAHSLCHSKTSLVPFFVMLRGGLPTAIEAYFGVSNPIQSAARCRALHASGKTPVLVLDGLDEVATAGERGDTLTWVAQFLQACSGEALVVLTCRSAVWKSSKDVSLKSLELQRHLLAAEDSDHLCSIELCAFTDTEMTGALRSYTLDPRHFSPLLLGMCRQPFLLRLIAEHAAAAEGSLPDPADLESFMPVFFDPKDKSQNTVLFRMGITKSVVSEVLGPFLQLIDSVDGSVDQKSLPDLWVQTSHRNWATLVSSGLLGVHRTYFSVEYSIAPEYRPYVGRMMQKFGMVGGTAETPCGMDVNTTDVLIESRQRVVDLWQKEQHKQMGREAAAQQVQIERERQTTLRIEKERFAAEVRKRDRELEKEERERIRLEAERKRERDRVLALRAEQARVEKVKRERDVAERTKKYRNGDVYEGDMVGGVPCGHGTVVLPNGLRYEGEWKDNKRSGHGTMVLSSGERYEGEWKDNKMGGHGICLYSDGERYEGEWKDNMRHGEGKQTRPHPSFLRRNRVQVVYKGTWCNDKPGGK